MIQTIAIAAAILAAQTPEEVCQNVVPQDDFPSGTGTTLDPYVLCTVADWNRVGGDPALLASAYALGADLDFSGMSIVPFGTATEPFRGTLDGRQHSMQNINLDTVSGANYVAPIRTTDGAFILQLRLTDITRQRWSPAYSGGLIAKATATTLAGIEIDYDLTGNDRFGGLVGHFEGGSMQDVHAAGVLRLNWGADAAGGLVGVLAASTVFCASSSAEIVVDEVWGQSHIGGLFGSVQAGTTIIHTLSDAHLDYPPHVRTRNGFGGIVGALRGSTMLNSIMFGHAQPQTLGAAVGTEHASVISQVLWAAEDLGPRVGQPGEAVPLSFLMDPLGMRMRGFAGVWRYSALTRPQLNCAQ